MADEADLAGEAIEMAMAKALANIKSTTGLPSLDACLECGDDIPKARQMLGGITRCVGCQTVLEQDSRNKWGQ